MRQKQWEPGTFMESIKEVVATRSVRSGSTTLPPSWSVLLSTNTLNTTSAGWIRVKFGLSYEASLPFGKPSILMLEDGVSDEDHPGLLVFECSYLEPTLSPEERLARLRQRSSFADSP